MPRDDRKAVEPTCANCGHLKRHHYRDSPMGSGCWRTDSGGDCPCPGYLSTASAGQNEEGATDGR